MPTITAQSIIDRAETLLLDTSNVRWPAAELLDWLNDGQRAIVAVRPDANAVTESVALVAGTKQSLPAEGYQLINVVRNMGTSGTSPGRAVRYAPMRLLNEQYPDWHTETATTTIEHFLTEPRSPKTFYVYPPATASIQVEIVYSKAPTNVASLGATITLDDIYATSLLDYVLYRAYSKDGEVPGSAARAVAHFQAFEMGLGLKAQADASATARSS